MPDFELADSDARPIDPIVPKFREWVILRAQVTEMTTRMNRLRDTVSQAVENRGYADHKGSQYIDLPFAVVVGDTSYSRIKRERRVSIIADDEAAERITRKKGCYDRAFPPVRHLDVDELYVLYQEDVLSQDELDEILTPRETFAFKGMA
jgi:hypothetical protein